MATALTAYMIPTASTTLATATQLLANTSGAGSQQELTKLGTATGYSEIFPVGTTNAWQALGSIPTTPSGNGWLWDVTTLFGQQFIAGNWNATLRVKNINGNGNQTVSFFVRFFKYNSNVGTYALIGTASQTGQSVTSSSANFTLPNASLLTTSFLTNEYLYIDEWYNVTANANSLAGASIARDISSSAVSGSTVCQFVTPGYQAIPATKLRVNGYGGVFS